ncbi:GIY-YIG nuclease family protein [Hymenobacter sp. RP-2-7]|uniref:GIY-YIG nuclease family protein n=1 Tax=Hymenobacter polaris TaxID=2682546 RepID=A0A7Y0FN19_9BACT|nr:GIY-YIG nuclease family protein [Hymenobacter polaris]NML66492.1 GIY-YIG nuclease family protein [Hymenobacter polaris]
MHTYYVYILTNQYNTVLYVGVTNNLERRVMEHKAGAQAGFTKQYKLTKLVYFETSPSVQDAIAREKQLKAGSRAKKLALVSELNPIWKDLLADY